MNTHTQTDRHTQKNTGRHTERYTCRTALSSCSREIFSSLESLRELTIASCWEASSLHLDSSSLSRFNSSWYSCSDSYTWDHTPWYTCSNWAFAINYITAVTWSSEKRKKKGKMKTKIKRRINKRKVGNVLHCTTDILKQKLTQVHIQLRYNMTISVSVKSP